MLSCPVCADSSSLPLCTVADMPLVGCQFAPSRHEALSALCGTLDLTLCKQCGHIYNRAFEADRVAYLPGYENTHDFSPRHRAELNATVDRLIRSYALHDKSVVELGCGTAEFLTALCAKGANHGVGYDPTQQNRAGRAGDGSVRVVAERFSAASQKPVDVVCSQHVLEHLADLRSTLSQARSILKRRGFGYFQVPSGLVIFRDLNIWDLTYEHVSYFSPASLHRALSAAGFFVHRLESSFGGQYLDAEAVVDTATGIAPVTLATYARFCDGFPDAYATIIRHWKDRITHVIENNRRIVLWGAGAKAVSFLNMLAIGTGDGIRYVVDINPRKEGRFIPGTAQRIVSPDFLRDYAPDLVIVMNHAYTSEIRSHIDSMGLRCELVMASPAIS